MSGFDKRERERELWYMYPAISGRNQWGLTSLFNLISCPEWAGWGKGYFNAYCISSSVLFMCVDMDRWMVSILGRNRSHYAHIRIQSILEDHTPLSTHPLSRPKGTTKVGFFFWFDFHPNFSIISEPLPRGRGILSHKFFLLWENCFMQCGCGEASISNGGSQLSVPSNPQKGRL